MKPSSIVLLVAVILTVPARADSITSVNGSAVTSINDASVSATGSFGPATVTGGNTNFIGVTSTGASVNVEILKQGPGANAPSNDSLAVSTVNAQNSGTVTATGTFSGASTTGNSNSIGVTAAGTSVNISIIKK